MLHTTTQHQAAVLLVCGDGDRGITRDGKAYSQLLDPIGQTLTHRGVPVCSAPRSFRSKLVGSAAFNNARPFLRVEAAAMILASGFRRLGFRFVGAWLESLVWHRVLAQYAVGFVLAIQPSEGLCLAGHQRGLRVIDFQHGSINLNSTYYIRCKKDLLKQKVYFVPSEVRCWDEVSAAGVLKEVGLPAGVAGHPGLAIPHDVPDENQAGQPLPAMVRANEAAGDFSVVLAVDSWTDSASDELLRHKFLRAIADGTRAVPVVRLMVRAHPVQYRKLWDKTVATYAEMFRDQVPANLYAEVAQAPLFSLLSKSSLVVTRGSGVIIEAWYLGRPVAVVGTEAQELRTYFQPEYLEDVTWLESESSAIADWVQQHHGQKYEVPDSRSAHAHQSAMNNWLEEVIREVCLPHRY